MRSNVNRLPLNRTSRTSVAEAPKFLDSVLSGTEMLQVICSKEGSLVVTGSRSKKEGAVISASCNKHQLKIVLRLFDRGCAASQYQLLIHVDLHHKRAYAELRHDDGRSLGYHANVAVSKNVDGKTSIPLFYQLINLARLSNDLAGTHTSCFSVPTTLFEVIEAKNRGKQ